MRLASNGGIPETSHGKCENFPNSETGVKFVWRKTLFLAWNLGKSCKMQYQSPMMAGFQHRTGRGANWNCAGNFLFISPVTALQEESLPAILRPSFLRESIQKFSTAG